MAELRAELPPDDGPALKILLDILHPAHVHFFRNAVAILGGDGHEVLVTARDKDLTLELLSLYDIPHRLLSREAQGKSGLIRELVRRNARLRRLVLRERPDVLASIGGISTAQVGFLTRTTNLIFYDTENATLSNLLSYPFASQVITPDCYRGRVLGRQATYPGYHELAYLHPDRFAPDPAVLARHGIDAGERYSVVRFVSWQAVHDLGVGGFSGDQKSALIEALRRHGQVFISSERPLPAALEELRLALPPHEVHHLLAFARLFIGESATMASESAVLGTPAIYVDEVGRGYTDEQERRYGLVSNYRPSAVERAIAEAVEILESDRKSRQEFRSAVERLLLDKIDVTQVIVRALLEGGLRPSTGPGTAAR